MEHALSLCQSQGLKIALASASPLYMLESVLEMFNIRHYFDAVVSAGDLPYSKPHPQVYLNAAEALGVPPVQCVALEDSVNGMIACKAARMRSIVVPSAEMAADPRWSLADYRLSSLSELTAAMIR
ncbi:2-deoxyglucose-6-phosphate hydrolase YniC [Klebsiella pneumoniae]|nr:2-deoxyglucose-6-phosphate hydrolase YniC [Klebsiella pneumoniae]